MVLIGYPQTTITLTLTHYS